MNLAQFIDKYDGEGVDYDGNGKYWCVDLARAYVEEVLQKDQFPLVVGAAGIWNLDLTDDYDKVLNKPKNVPEPGDLIIWNRRVGGGFGHVGIADSANLNWFTSFDQNWPTGTLSHLVDHSYSSIYGWLHPKENMSEELEACMKDREKFWQERDVCNLKLDELNDYNQDLAKKLEDCQKSMVALNERYDNVNTDLKDCGFDLDYTFGQLAELSGLEVATIKGVDRAIEHIQNKLDQGAVIDCDDLSGMELIKMGIKKWLDIK